MKKVFLIYGHYVDKSFNAAIKNTFVQTAEENGHEVDWIDLYKEKFNPIFAQGIISLTLDDLINKFNLPVPNYLKIDVDGIEYKIIKSAKNILKNQKLESILIEINPSRKEDVEIIDILEKNNFKFNKEQVKQSTRKEGPHKGYAEYLFFR